MFPRPSRLSDVAFLTQSRYNTNEGRGIGTAVRLYPKENCHGRIHYGISTNCYCGIDAHRGNRYRNADGNRRRHWCQHYAACCHRYVCWVQCGCARSHVACAGWRSFLSVFMPSAYRWACSLISIGKPVGYFPARRYGTWYEDRSGGEGIVGIRSRLHGC